MSNSQRQAVITLILQKEGKDRTLVENWRPISLVKVDAKECFASNHSLQSNWLRLRSNRKTRIWINLRRNGQCYL